MRNNKHTLILLLVFGVIASFLWSDVNDDLRVIYGLYQDNNYNLTLQEIQRFKSNYPDNDKIEILKSLEGNIALHRQKYALADSIFNSVDLTNLDEETQASLLLGRIQSKFMLGDYAASAQFVTQFMKRYPNTSNYWQAIYWSAKLDIQFQKYDDAINSLKMIQDKPEREMIYSTLIEALSLNQNTNESETYLKRMILDFPNSEFTHQSYLNQMQALYAAGKLDSLRTYLGYFIPDHSIYYNDYLLLQGKICYTLTDYDSSLKYLNKIQPENEDSKFYQGLNYYQLRQDSKAKEIFSDLANKAKDNQVRSNSFLQNQIMLYETDSKAALFNMEWYIQNHPDDPLLGAYYFQVGYCQYKQKKYSLAFTKLTKAVSYRLDPITEDKTFYLMGDIYYLTDDKNAAEQSFLDYIRRLPNGLFADEVLCKLGFIYYDRKEMDKAKDYFQQVLQKYPNSNKIAISNFYLGEINYFKSNYKIAKNYYTQSQSGNLDTGYTWLRIAQCDYFIEDYTSALAGIKNIPEKKPYLFDKYLLKGNIYFNQNDYNTALQAYSIAEKNYQTKAEWEQVISQEGLSFYLLKRFPEATAIYRQLSKEASTSDKFLMLAANSAFSAQDYQQSTYLYNLFIKTYPDSPNRDKALLGIADSHYNLGNFGQAANEYIDILQTYQNGRLSEDALKALSWSLKLAKEQDFSVALINLEQNVQDSDLKQKVKRVHLDYVRGMKEWNRTIQIADDIITSSPSDLKIQMIKAEALANMKRYNEADSVFQKIQPENLTPDVYLSWSNVDIIKGDSLAALNKLKISSKKSNDPIIWLPLLSLQLKLDDPDFNDYYLNFIKSRPGTVADSADIIWCEWGTKQQRYEEVNAKLQNLMKSNDRQIRGTAEFMEARLSFLQGHYQEAIPQLARIKYLYPELADKVIESQYMLCLSYIRTKDIETALTIYNTIRPDLNQHQIAIIESELNASGRN